MRTWLEDASGREPEGLDVFTSVECGRLLQLYLELLATDVAKALRRILDGGDNELALQMAISAEALYQNNAGIAR